METHGLNVNKSDLLKIASNIDEFLKTYDNNIKKIDSELLNLGMVWQGKDYNNIKFSWDSTMNGEVLSKSKSSLQALSDVFRKAEEVYRKTQESIVELSNDVLRS